MIKNTRSHEQVPHKTLVRDHLTQVTACDYRHSSKHRLSNEQNQLEACHLSKDKYPQLRQFLNKALESVHSANVVVIDSDYKPLRNMIMRWWTTKANNDAPMIYKLLFLGEDLIMSALGNQAELELVDDTPNSRKIESQSHKINANSKSTSGQRTRTTGEKSKDTLTTLVPTHIDQTIPNSQKNANKDIVPEPAPYTTIQSFAA
ncbi:hypothetical protein H5410_041771 [Solanum commersonii]|uniref:Uncharacterized protein n=1 Tax=Solanum commersonii TaxID=4109 RepID=A0A9J5XSU5_SOLCO|nr:hypothetical protein H5410_041771 [Solanum commersonii]